MATIVVPAYQRGLHIRKPPRADIHLVRLLGQLGAQEVLLAAELGGRLRRPPLREPCVS